MRKKGLQSYGSGDGSLSFAYVDKEGKASGARITRRMVDRHLANKENRHLLDTGWFVFQEHKSPYFKLVKRIDRAGPGRLRMLESVYHEGGRQVELVEFDYDPSAVERRDYGEVLFDSLKVTCEPHADLKALGMPLIHVKNWSILGTIRYFLSREEEITMWIAENKVPTLEETLRAPELRHVGSGI